MLATHIKHGNDILHIATPKMAVNETLNLFNRREDKNSTSLFIRWYRTKKTPTANFWIYWSSPYTPWMLYIVRVETWGTAYTVTLGNTIRNPYNLSLSLTSNKVTTFTFLATSYYDMELYDVKTES